MADGNEETGIILSAATGQEECICRKMKQALGEAVACAVDECIRENVTAEGRKEGVRNTIQMGLDCGADLRNVIVKTAEKYQEDEKVIWDIWEKGNKKQSD